MAADALARKYCLTQIRKAITRMHADASLDRLKSICVHLRNRLILSALGIDRIRAIRRRESRSE